VGCSSGSSHAAHAGASTMDRIASTTRRRA
jgi:hypothetical protein